MFPSLSFYFCESVKCPSVSCYLLEKHLLGTTPVCFLTMYGQAVYLPMQEIDITDYQIVRC